jgi:hypothetical protein
MILLSKEVYMAKLPQKIKNAIQNYNDTNEV